MKERLQQLQEEALSALQQAADLKTLQDVRVQVLGKKGSLTEVMKGMVDSLEKVPFEPPEGVVTVAVCSNSGLIPTRYCPESIQEIFIAGKEPTRPCDRHLPTESSFIGSGMDFREIDRQDLEEGGLQSP